MLCGSMMQSGMISIGAAAPVEAVEAHIEACRIILMCTLAVMTVSVINRSTDDRVKALCAIFTID